MDLFSASIALLVIGAPIAFVVIGIFVFVTLTRRRRREDAELDRNPHPGRGITRLIAALAAGYAAAAAMFGASAATGFGLALASRDRGFGVDIGLVRLPVPDSAATELPASALSGSLLNNPGFFSEVVLSSPPISNSTALLYFAPAIITPLLHLIVAIGIATLAGSIDRRSAFVPHLGRVAMVVGWALVVLGTASEVLHGMGVDRAGREILADGSLGAIFGVAELDLTSAAAGAAVLLMGTLAQRGLQLQRETAGLV